MGPGYCKWMVPPGSWWSDNGGVNPLKRVLAVGAIGAAAAVLPTTGADAIGPIPLGPVDALVGDATQACTAAGKVNVSQVDEGYFFHLYGEGSCEGSAAGTVSLNGYGYAATLGACDASGVVSGLRLHVEVTRADGATLTTTPQTWSSVASAFPAATPFLVNQGGATRGAGSITGHTTAACPDQAGSSTATFSFVVL